MVRPDRGSQERRRRGAAARADRLRPHPQPPPRRRREVCADHAIGPARGKAAHSWPHRAEVSSRFLRTVESGDAKPGSAAARAGCGGRGPAAGRRAHPAQGDRRRCRWSGGGAGDCHRAVPPAGAAARTRPARRSGSCTGIAALGQARARGACETAGPGGSRACPWAHARFGGPRRGGGRGPWLQACARHRGGAASARPVPREAASLRRFAASGKRRTGGLREARLQLQASLDLATAALATDAADVCIIAEGCYPFVRGGVSAWIDWLMREEKDLTFEVVTIWPSETDLQSRYEFPPNMRRRHHLALHSPAPRPRFFARKPFDPSALAEALITFTSGGTLAELAVVDRIINPPGRQLSRAQIMNSPAAWEVARLMYERMMPQASFLHFFWAWRAIYGGLFAALKFELPKARLYHTISTGYAGLLAARASIETARPAVLTEHGIYTNERRIEILMADWIADTIEKGLALHDPRYDLRDMWTQAFEAYAKVCYEASEDIVTLYADNQILQRAMGADPARLKVIANGLDFGKFAGIGRAADDARPTIALIGRVVPIKDVKTFIMAAALLREDVKELRALVLGPTEEDPDYFKECEALAAQLGLGGCLEFTGNVHIIDWLPEIHVVALTSLSEAQPLVLLEAGAAGLPCVTTNVGSCAEVLNGRPDEEPACGPGGLVTDVVAPRDIARALKTLLLEPDLRRRYGGALQSRVKSIYANERAVKAYRELYERCRTMPSRRPIAATGE
ncbi:MAG: DUF3492 domain-containing protein [Hyphomicrobiaceae bacterium]|nr:MAG: DUF3492 domain-containing protein [Hyphomicrobiaceae bacterium]